ncbi:hypothetical protein [Phenylobacterium sp.]|uniref:hypothetical protein n=1 Tax=Phenylobacterium sp. TaxID=1871053 RepID=UPI0027365C4B|nr:hypothetical protein [Phenylobacterium sp.]MDP3853645.1 hypothetical protein [Phenylobacterium sp.]
MDTPRTAFAAARPERVAIHPLIAQRIVRIQGRSDRVALTHQGETMTFDDPQDLRETILRVEAEDRRAAALKAWDALPWYARLQFDIAGARLEYWGAGLSGALVGLLFTAARIGLFQ